MHVVLRIRKRMPRAKPHYLMWGGAKYRFSKWTKQIAEYAAGNGSVIRVHTSKKSDMRFVKNILDPHGGRLDAIDAYRSHE